MDNGKVSLTLPWLGIGIATVLWTIMFSPWTAPYVDFWTTMTCSALILTLFSCYARPRWWKDIELSVSNVMIGVALAALLWGVFWLGNMLSSLMFDFARPQVEMIYGMKDGADPWVLTLLLLFIIGPAEEIFWRGFIQNRLSARWNPDIGFVITTLVYGLVHLSKCNFMLIMAAMVAGFVWGLAYRLFPERFSAIVISHALWDCAVFVWFPI